jgi:hypothetical protein
MANKVKTDLSRAEMEAVIKGGGSVLHGGVVHTSSGTLPEDEESLATAEKELEKRRAKASGKAETSDDEEQVDLDSMTKAELIEFAKANEIEVKVSAPKEEIRAAIEEALA